MELTGGQRGGVVTQGIGADAVVVRNADVAGAARPLGAGESAGYPAAARAAGYSGAG